MRVPTSIYVLVPNIRALSGTCAVVGRTSNAAAVNASRGSCLCILYGDIKVWRRSRVEARTVRNTKAMTGDRLLVVLLLLGRAAT